MRRYSTLTIGETRVVVVDPHSDDYSLLAADSRVSGSQVDMVASASDAIKLPRTGARTIWLINLELPDASGCDLAAAVRARDPRSTVYLVSDTYDPAAEMQARRVGGTMYVCKPAAADWLSVAPLPPPALPCCA